MSNSILIVDDEQGIREALSSILADEGYEPVAVASGEECLSLLEERSIDLVLLDVWLDGIDGLDTLERIRKNGVDAMVVMISGHASIETAVRATKLGAFDFVEKPLSLEKVILVIKNALEVHRLARENRQLREELGGRTQLQGDTVPMRALQQQIICCRRARIGTVSPCSCVRPPSSSRNCRFSCASRWTSSAFLMTRITFSSESGFSMK